MPVNGGNSIVDKEGTSFGKEYGAEGKQTVFEKLSDMIMNQEIVIGGDTPPIDPNGGNFAKLQPPTNPFEGTGVELTPPSSDSSIAWAGGVGLGGNQVRLDLIAHNE